MIESVVLTVDGMKCGGCETNVTGKLETIIGVVSVSASHQDKEISVKFDTEITSMDSIINAITDAGFMVNDSSIKR
jgi:copper chaperone